jgi:tetratricopeptide (TPR) repeat protein
MNSNKTKNIFFSYSWKDRPIAMRIYWDLIRSNHSVWRDQIDGEPVENFKKEFLIKIDECEYFILLDSENYRNISSWCKVELEHFIESKRNNPSKKIILCLIQEDGEWRKRDVFFVEHLNLLKYIDFSFKETYDNDNNYECAINEVSYILGSEYVPWYKFPFEKDFEDELSQVNRKLSDVDREILLNDYKAIRTRKNQGIPVELRLETLLIDLKRLRIQSIFPYLLSGINKADLKKYTEAKEVFEEIISLFPKDSRGYRGLGAIYFHLKDFHKSIQTFIKSISITEKYGNKVHKGYLPEIFLNLSSVLIEVKKYEEALSYCLKNYMLSKKNNKLHPQIFLNLDYCYDALGNKVKQQETLEEGIYYFRGEPEIHGRYAKFFFDCGNIEKAISHYEIAYKYDQSIKYCVALAYTYFIVDDILNYLKFENIALELEAQNVPDISDYYHIGLIYYLKNELEQAKYYYSKSESQDLYYDKLVKFDL